MSQKKIYARQNIRICGVKSTFHKFVIRNEKEQAKLTEPCTTRSQPHRSYAIFWIYIYGKKSVIYLRW